MVTRTEKEDSALENADLLAEMVRAIVRSPDSVVVESSLKNGRQSLLIRASPDEVGQVIGRNGNVIRTLQAFFEVIGNRSREPVEVDVFNPIKPRCFGAKDAHGD